MTWWEWLLAVVACGCFIGAVGFGVVTVRVYFSYKSRTLQNTSKEDHAEVISRMANLDSSMTTIHNDLDEIKIILRGMQKKEEVNDHKPDGGM